MHLDPKETSLRVANEGRGIARGFAQFLLRGKVTDLAVAVVIGAAAGTFVTSFVRDLFTPLVGVIFGSHMQTGSRYVVLHGEKFAYGDFINQVVSFLAIATVVYFLVILPTNKLVSNAYFQPPPDPSTRKCPRCVSEIPKAATRCAFCTTDVEPLVDEIPV